MLAGRLKIQEEANERTPSRMYETRVFFSLFSVINNQSHATCGEGTKNRRCFFLVDILSFSSKIWTV